VPDDSVVTINSTFVAMIGTDRKPARCTALMGNVGDGVRCTMYENRSSSCQDFHASWTFGERNLHCDAARAAHGLSPLEPPLEPSINPERVA
jgi:Fe-S-cluster containining protein